MFLNKLLLIIIILNISKLKIDIHNEYTIQVDNKQFLAMIYLKEKIQLTLIEIEVISSSYYFTELSLESLCKYNKIFKQYDTLEDAYNCIQKLFEKEKIKIYNNQDNLSLGLIMNSASCDNEEVIIKLEEKKLSKDEINEKVRMETNSLRKKIKIIDEENKILKEKMKDYESRLDYLELKSVNIDTKIINKKSELQFIKNELEEKYKVSNINFNLKYRASRDGDQYDNIYSNLASYNNLLLLFYTTKGIKFGVFLYKGLNNNIGYNNYNYGYNYNYGNNNYINIKSFAFSIDTNKIYYIENDEKIICFNKKCSNDKQLKEYLINIYSKDLLSDEKRMNYVNKISEISGNELNEEDKYFNLQEIEAFQVSYTSNPNGNKNKSKKQRSSYYY